MQTPAAIATNPASNIAGAALPAEPFSDELIRLRDVEAIVGLKCTSIYELLKEGRFPKPAKIGRNVRWSRREVHKWVADRLSERDAN